MKIDLLIKELNSIKRKFGNVEVGFDTVTVDPNADEFMSVTDVGVLGVFMVRTDGENRGHKTVILGDTNMDSAFSGQKDLMETR